MKHPLLSGETGREAFEGSFTTSRCEILKGVMGNSSGNRPSVRGFQGGSTELEARL